MKRLLTFMTALLIIFAAAVAGFAGTDKKTSTTWTNEQGVEVKGNWSTGNIVEINTVEEYYWHKDNYDPSVHYRIAPWLYDPFNLSRESGASGKD